MFCVRSLEYYRKISKDITEPTLYKNRFGETREALVDSVWGRTGYARSFWEVESKDGIREDLKAQPHVALCSRACLNTCVAEGR